MKIAAVNQTQRALRNFAKTLRTLRLSFNSVVHAGKLGKDGEGKPECV